MMIDKESSRTIVFWLGGNIMVNTDRMTAEMIKELAFSEEELESLAKERSTPISFDEDCLETTPEHVNVLSEISDYGLASARYNE